MLAPSLLHVIDLTESVTTTTYDTNVQTVDRMSIQVNATDATPEAKEFVAADVDPSVFAQGTITVLDYAALTGAVVTIAGHDLTEGVDWDAETSNDVTADNLATAIDALTEVTAANPAANVITVIAATAGAAGNSITMVTDALPADLLLSGATLEDGEDISTITITDHGFVTGLKIPLTGTNLPTGLSATNYWAIVIDEDTLRLATSLVNANAGTFVIISAAGTTADAALTPSALGSSTVEVQASLDGVNYFSFATPKTITITTTSNQYLDLGQVTYPCVRVKFTAPTAGALTLDVLLYAVDTQVRVHN